MTTLYDDAIFALAAGGVQALNPYEPGKPLAELEREYGISDAVKLASNENPLGMSQKVTKAIIDATQHASLYPDGNAYYLKQALVQYLSTVEDAKVKTSQLIVGNGSNELLEIIARSFAGQQDAIMYSQHAFAVYPLVTQAIGATHQRIPAIHWGHDLNAMQQGITDKTKIIFIANPNNPTGTYLASDTLLLFLKAVPKHIIVVVDEAYHEYINPERRVSALTYLNDFENLIVTRTFSKAYGLAGLRIGYCISQSAVANILNRVRQPFNVNVMAQSAAEAALSDQTFIHESVVINNAGKKQLYQAFDTMGLSYILSEGNFIAVEVKSPVAEVNERLLTKGVIIRPIEAYQMPGYLRVSVGTETQNGQFIHALTSVLSECESVV